MLPPAFFLSVRREEIRGRRIQLTLYPVFTYPLPPRFTFNE
jgi:hypothetical protein